MPPTRQRALLIIDEGSVVHNHRLIGRLGTLVDLSVEILKARPARLPRRSELLVRELRLCGRLLTSRWPYRRRSLLACSSGHFAALLVARLAAVIGNDMRVFLYNFYFHRLGRLPPVRMALRALLTDRVCVVAQSRRDLEYFASLGSSAQLGLVVYGQDQFSPDTTDQGALGDYVFAGGYTNRAYDALLRCARSLTHLSFVIVASTLNPLSEPTPPNVSLYRDLGQHEFHQLLGRSRMVVIPLAEDVGASGQMVLLAAMHMGKAIVIPDFDVVAQYVDHSSAVVYPGGDEQALCAAIGDVFFDEAALRALGNAARERYRRLYTREPYDDAILERLTEFARLPR